MKEVFPYVLEKRRAQQREYKQRPEVKARTKAYMAEYARRPDTKAKVKAYKAEYLLRPEVKERQRAYMKEYTKRPEVKERRKAYEAKIALQKRIDKAVAFLKEHGYSVIKEEPHEQQSGTAVSTDSGHVS